MSTITDILDATECRYRIERRVSHTRTPGPWLLFHSGHNLPNALASIARAKVTLTHYDFRLVPIAIENPTTAERATP